MTGAEVPQQPTQVVPEFRLPGSYSVEFAGERQVRRVVTVKDYVWFCEHADCGWSGSGHESARTALNEAVDHHFKHHSAPANEGAEPGCRCGRHGQSATSHEQGCPVWARWAAAQKAANEGAERAECDICGRPGPRRLGQGGLMVCVDSDGCQSFTGVGGDRG